MIDPIEKCRPTTCLDKAWIPDSGGLYVGATFLCELAKGHEGPHQFTMKWDDNGERCD